MTNSLGSADAISTTHIKMPFAVSFWVGNFVWLKRGPLDARIKGMRDEKQEAADVHVLPVPLEAVSISREARLQALGH